MGRKLSRLGLFTVFGDESDTHPDKASRVYSVAGYVAYAQDWDGFDARWSEALRPLNLDYFHMSEYEAEVGVYGERPDEAKGVFDALLGIISDHKITPFAATIDWADWTRIPLRNGIRDPYDDLVRFFTEAVIHSAHSIKYPETDQFLFIFEETDDDKMARFTRAFNRAKRNAPWGGKLLDVVFSGKGDHRGTEAADILAFDVRRHELLTARQERITRGASAAQRYSTKWLTSGGREIIHWRLIVPS